MFNNLQHSGKFLNAVRSVHDFEGSTSLEVHMSGLEGPISLVSTNTCNGTPTCVNHALKTVILGSDAPISVAVLENGYKAILFNHPAMLTAMLVSPHNEGRVACVGYAEGHKVPFHNLDSSDYGVITASPYDVAKAGMALRETIRDAMKERARLSSNSFKLFLDEADIASFYSLMNVV